MTTLVVHPCERPLQGSAPVPADDRIGVAALVLGALGDGPTRIDNPSRGPGANAAAACLRTMGVVFDEPAGNALVVHGTGLGGLRSPEGLLESASSRGAFHLLGGILAAQRFRTTLVGDASLGDVARTIPRGIAALRARGAVIDAAPRALAVGAGRCAWVLGPLPEGRRLGPIEVENPDADPDVKAAVLLSGLFASAVTRYKEPSVSRDHLERALEALGVPLRTVGPVIELDVGAWDRHLPAFELRVPGDVSAAGLLVAAAQIVSGSRIAVRDVGVNPTRAGFLEVARDMGAGLFVEPQGERRGEPVATLHAWSASLRGILIGGETVVRAADDMPVACVLAARAAGVTRIRDVALLSSGDDPLGAVSKMLAAFGVTHQRWPDGIDVVGSETAFSAADVDTGGDPVVAMTATILALGARGPSRIRQAGPIAGRYPKFVATLRGLGAHVDVEP
jgi:3-phosphoshikimate 1-carboxyvinyltransferase